MMAQPMQNERPEFEHHYTIAELADLWHIATPTLKRWFAAEPDVPNFGLAESSGRRKRPYISMRIPISVALRVYRRNMNLADPPE